MRPTIRPATLEPAHSRKVVVGRTSVRYSDEARAIEQRLEEMERTLAHMHDLLVTVLESSQNEATNVALDIRAEMLADEGGSYVAKDLAALIGVSRATIYNWHKKGDIIGVAYLGRKYKFPAWQFDGSGLLPGLSEVIHLLEEGGPWTQIAFMLNPNLRLDGERPLDFLRRGDVQPVVEAARLYGEHEPI